jgi:hypothetical protein
MSISHSGSQYSEYILTYDLTDQRRVWRPPNLSSVTVALSGHLKGPELLPLPFHVLLAAQNRGSTLHGCMLHYLANDGNAGPTLYSNFGGRERP